MLPFVVDALNLRLELFVLEAIDLKDHDPIFQYDQFVLVYLYQA